MRRPIKFLEAMLAVACLAIAACGGNGTADSSTPNSNSIRAKVLDAVAPSTASLNGTTIPAATQIVDASANVWTVAGGVVYENGIWAPYSSAVTLLLYDGNVIYQENSAGSWWSWNGSTWVRTTDPRLTASLNGTSIPAATQITDGSANVWTVSGGFVYENGVGDGISTGAALLLYDNNVLYQENANDDWWSWDGSTWVPAGTDPRLTASASGTTIPAAAQITDGDANVWTVAGGVVYENGSWAPYSAGVTQLEYVDNGIYAQDASGAWYSWNGGTWVDSTSPPSAAGATPPAISGSPPTSVVAGDAYRFLPTTTNPGGGALSFSIANMPAWASFSTVTGALTGTPSSAQAGVYSDMIISVSDGNASSSLAAFAITVTTGTASLSWTPPTQNTDGTDLTDLAGYRVSYGTDAGNLQTIIQVADPSATSYVVSNLSSGTYFFSVAAYTTAGAQGLESSVVSKTIP